MNKYTSFELSKKLWDNECRLYSEKKWCFFDKDTYIFLESENYLKSNFHKKHEECFTYDFIWDICIKYAGDFFFKSEDVMIINNSFVNVYNYKLITKEIFKMIQDDVSQDKIEEYIWDNCLFNPKNKENRLKRLF